MDGILRTCINCHSINRFVFDSNECDVVCLDCGYCDAVLSHPTWRLPLHGDKNDHPYVSNHCSFHSTKSPPYNRIYHLQERIAQWYGNGPTIPEEALEIIGHEILTPSSEKTKYISLLPLEDLSRIDIQLVCKMVASEILRLYPHFKGVKQYGERWLQIKGRLLGDYYPIQRPSDHLTEWIKYVFFRLQDPFHRLKIGRA